MDDKKPVPVYFPFLIVLFPILLFFSENLAYMLKGSIIEILIIMILVSMMTGGIYLLLKKVLKDRYKAGLVTSILALGFFSFTRISSLIIDTTGKFMAYEKQLIFLLVVSLTLIYLIIRTKRDLTNIVKIVQFAAICLFLFSVIGILGYVGRYYSKIYSPFKQMRMDHEKAVAALVQTHQPEIPYKPDIYYFILDRYGNKETLKNDFDFDNSAFYEFLEEKGFFVARESYSNYLFTDVSVTSSLNMMLHDKPENIFRGSGELRPLFYLMENNKLFNFFKSRGYTVINAGDVYYEPTVHNKNADINMHFFPFRKLSFVIIQTSILGPFSNKYLDFYADKFNYDNLLRQFEEFGRIPEMEGPVFLFAHILSPHDPFIFDEDGSYMSFEEGQSRGYAASYRAQVIATNNLLMKTIDTILEKSDKPPIIIIQGDEGPYPINPRTTSWLEATPAELRSKTGIINAYYLPGFDKSNLYHSITPVNSFKLVLNHYFGMELEFSPDDTFSSGKEKYGFKNVTNEIRDRIETVNSGE
jgi:hypothetical protein